jgi:hypothetical protein
MRNSQDVYIEEFVNPTKGNTTKIKKYYRVPTFKDSTILVTVHGKKFDLHYEEDSSHPNGEILIYRISTEEKNFYASENISQRNKETEDAVMYLEKKAEKEISNESVDDIYGWGSPDVICQAHVIITWESGNVHLGHVIIAGEKLLVTWDYDSRVWSFNNPVEMCYQCGKPTDKPIYGSRNEEDNFQVPYHKQCAVNKGREWEQEIYPSTMQPYYRSK